MIDAAVITDISNSLKVLFKPDNTEGTFDDGVKDAGEILKEKLSASDVKAVFRTIRKINNSYGDSYNFGVYAVLQALHKLKNYYGAIEAIVRDINEPNKT